MMIISVSAVLAGAVCGDHVSPISDTTVMSSAGAQSNHINHVTTQMQYAAVVAVISFIGYFVIALPVSYICGFVLDWGIEGIWVGYPVGLTLTGGMMCWRFYHFLRKKDRNVNNHVGTPTRSR